MCLFMSLCPASACVGGNTVVSALSQIWTPSHLSPDRSHNGKTPPAVSLLLWDTERSGLKGVIQVTDSNRGLLLELFICAPSQFFLIITHLFRTSFSILYHFSTDYNSLSINIRHRCTWYFGQLVGDEDRKLAFIS